MNAISQNLSPRASAAFSAGCLGAVANSLLVWAFGALGVTQTLGVAIAPVLTPEWLYPRIVWGGLWGFLFLITRPSWSWWAQGLFLSLGPTAVQLLLVFPLKTPAGLLGLGLGAATPFFVLLFNAAWGLVAALWLRQTAAARMPFGVVQTSG